MYGNIFTNTIAIHNLILFSGWMTFWLPISGLPHYIKKKLNISLFYVLEDICSVYHLVAEAKQSADRRRLQLSWRLDLLTSSPTALPFASNPQDSPLHSLLNISGSREEKLRMSFFKAKKGAGVASKEEMRHRREVKRFVVHNINKQTNNTQKTNKKRQTNKENPRNNKTDTKRNKKRDDTGESLLEVKFSFNAKIPTE